MSFKRTMIQDKMVTKSFRKSTPFNFTSQCRSLRDVKVNQGRVEKITPGVPEGGDVKGD